MDNGCCHLLMRRSLAYVEDCKHYAYHRDMLVSHIFFILLEVNYSAFIMNADNYFKNALCSSQRCQIFTKSFAKYFNRFFFLTAGGALRTVCCVQEASTEDPIK